MIPVLIADTDNALTPMARATIAELWDLMCDLDRRIHGLDFDAVFKADPTCQRIAATKGVGPKIATAIVAAVGNGAEFRNGRHMAAWLGLVPRQHPSGDRRLTMGISKRGSQHLRSLLVHGARAVVRTAPNKLNPHNRWVNDLRKRLATAVSRRPDSAAPSPVHWQRLRLSWVR